MINRLIRRYYLFEKGEGNNIGSFIEAICNTNSSYFVAIYNSIYLCHQLKNSKNLLKFFKYFFYLETLYCYVNGSKLLNYFEFNEYDDFFNNINNKLFYQNALVFEYIVLRMFLIQDYYQLLLKPLLKNNFNELTTYNSNLTFQRELNNKLLKKMEKKHLKKIFNDISYSLKKYNHNFIEYFPVDLLI